MVKKGLKLLNIFLLILFCLISGAECLFSQESVKSDSIKSVYKKSNTLKIASWNIKDLGRSKDASEIIQIAEIIGDFDIVAIQEVVGKDPAGAQAVAKIADELNRMGSKWDYRVSDPTKSPSAYISERYAFLWKTSKVSLSGRAYLDAALEEVCDREPYIGEFLQKNSTESFYIVNFHSRKHDSRPEDEIIFFRDYLTRLSSENIFILGDFNLNEKHEVWDNLYQKGFTSALKDSKTTLKTKCKALNYLNYAIDNIYYSSGKIKMHQTGKVDFVKDCNNLENSRFISDHLPIYIEFVIN
ncbi:endonuclease/exonuclease/phosphatase family protein [Algibacter sp. L3A6]|uniref:endonuclease/exonuclease/phosphatase family protein n=1 Tax=Algibacter sp. L3A6 TaxID=2686366 RepID=UPI00131DE00F|nr:endonuclease/exonuclease/phosphatase family protein [Algibacter sp. L3A6]